MFVLVIFLSNFSWTNYTIFLGEIASKRKKKKSKTGLWMETTTERVVWKRPVWKKDKISRNLCLVLSIIHYNCVLLQKYLGWELSGSSRKDYCDFVTFEFPTFLLEHLPLQIEGPHLFSEWHLHQESLQGFSLLSDAHIHPHFHHGSQNRVCKRTFRSQLYGYSFQYLCQDNSSHKWDILALVCSALA